MIEMLGVLFVIGILSIGGIAAYRMAMRNIFENDILDVLSIFSLSIDMEYLKKGTPYFSNSDGVSYFSKYFCDNYLEKKYCSRPFGSQKDQRYYFSNEATWYTYTTNSGYGKVFCFGYRFLNQKRDRQLCQSLVAQTANLENLIYWTNYHHYKIGSKTIPEIQDVFCRSENNGGNGETGVDFCFF